MADDLQTVVQRMIDAGESEANIAAVIQHAHAAPSPVAPEGAGAATLPLASTSTAANLAMRFGTNPNAPKVGSMLGRITGAVSAPIVGAYEGGMPGLVAGMVSAPNASWMGGKTGWFGTKMLQSAARPIAGALEKAAPYASGLSAVQGGLDLAQMAEPNRKDIGFLGVGGGTSDKNDPALLNAIYAAVRKRLSSQP